MRAAASRNYRKRSTQPVRLLAAALVVAVAALSAVGFFADRVRQALERESHQLLGADLLLTADHAVAGEAWPTQARATWIAVVETRTFPSMVTRGEGRLSCACSLAEIKAVGAGYPLRGVLRIAPALNVPDAPARGCPPAGNDLDRRASGDGAGRAGR
jgi:putative ABC transport system permease protein